MYDPYQDFQKDVLPNGLEVHSLFMDRPWIICKIIVHSGAKEDPPHLPGLAHFVEHVCAENIPNWECRAAGDYFNNLGGYGSFGTTSFNSTKYGFKIPADQKILAQALQIFGSLLFEETLVKNIERERKVIIQEFRNEYPSDEDINANREELIKLYENHPLATYTDPLGTEKSIQSISPKDLQNFYDTHYTPANVSIVFVGGIDNKKLLKALTASPFNSSKKGTRTPLPPPLISLPGNLGSRTVKQRSKKYLNDNSKQVAYNADWILPYSLSMQAVSIFTEMLNKTMFADIREKNALVYDIRGNYNYCGDIVHWKVRSTFTPSPGMDMETLVEQCMSSVPHNSKLFELCLSHAINRCSMIDVSGDIIATDAQYDLVEYQSIRTVQKVLEKWNNVTFEHMQEIASYLTPERRHTVIYEP